MKSISRIAPIEERGFSLEWLCIKSGLPSEFTPLANYLSLIPDSRPGLVVSLAFDMLKWCGNAERLERERYYWN